MSNSQIRSATTSGSSFEAAHQVRCHCGCIPNEGGIIFAAQEPDSQVLSAQQVAPDDPYTLRQEHKDPQHQSRAWAQHAAATYFASAAWQDKTQKVCQEDPMCTACGQVPSSKALHRTYEWLFREPLFDLTGVCLGCYLIYHREDKLNEAINDLAPSAYRFVLRFRVPAIIRSR